MDSEESKGSGDRKGYSSLGGIFRPPKATHCRGSEPEETDLRLNSEAGKLMFTAFAFVIGEVRKVEQLRLFIAFNFFDFETSH